MAGDRTYVLIHGGRTSARFWDRTVAHLDRRAIAVDLPGRGPRPADLATITVDDEVAAVVADVTAHAPDGPLVLVAHSSGGLVVPGVVAALGDRVTHLVLNAASVPPEGGCGLDCMVPQHRALVEAAAAHARTTSSPLPSTGLTSADKQRTAYGGDPLDDETVAFMSDPVRSVDDTLNHYFQPVRFSAAAHVPVTYVVNERDRPVPVELQETMIERLPTPPRVVRLDTGHIPAVTHPERFAAVVLDAAR